MTIYRNVLRIVLCVIILFMTFASGSMVYNYCEDHVPISVWYGTSMSACAEVCTELVNCHYITYNRRRSRCAVFETVSFTTARICLGNVLLSGHTITKYSSPNNLANDTDDGILYLCPRTLVKDNARILGNINNIIGARKKVDCVSPYTIDGLDFSVCLPDNSWSECGQCVISCLPPLQIDNLVYASATIINAEGTITESYPDTNNLQDLVYFDGSFLIAECSQGSLQGSQTVTCNVGLWSDFPLCQLSTMRMACTRDSDCIESNTECREGKCWCTPGKSYSPSHSSCVDSCPTYGDTFQEVRSYAVYGYDKTQMWKSNEAGCKAACEAASSSTCISAEYEFPLKLCYYNSRQPYQVPNSFKRNSDFYFYIRDCA